jgi:hypothetical protein
MKSTETNVQSAIELMNDMETAEEIAEFIAGDDRKGVINAAEARTKDLTGGEKKDDEGIIRNDAGQVVRKVENGKYVHALFTVNCPRDSDPKGLKRVPVNIDGTHPDGTSFQYIASIQRGINVPNVPYCALAVLANAIETRYWVEEKPDRSGQELKKESGPSYPFSVIEGPYWTRKTEK